ncbi:DUF2752 domain-containing protein [Cellulosimicrobium marinum]|uniref:DUF2752 domain-containing protein n=1 Tax=Cellulosimicrobium marinum TaxID=1638992 RepID=UPI001E435EB5|nr:DUF2752 domain-containing protein [Cellulosimicrobium marinum]MCB7137367.1 DUF2752 domain-containing protein [Cellulosimicrobium marinum]
MTHPGTPAGTAAVVPRGLRGATAPVVTGAVVVAAVLYVALTDPHRPGGFLTCPLLALTGLACPGCGGLRATYDMVHLDLAGAWSMNPLWVLVAPVLVVLWGAWLVRAWRGRPGPLLSPRVSPTVAWTALVVLVAFGVLRNVPVLEAWLGPAAG